MPRVIGIDPGTVSLDLCGLDEGRVFLDRSISTADALAAPALVAGVYVVLPATARARQGIG